MIKAIEGIEYATIEETISTGTRPTVALPIYLIVLWHRKTVKRIIVVTI